MKRLMAPLLASALAACAVGPDYERPSAPVPAAYKEAPRTGDAVWLPAAPADTLARGDWWRLFGDAELDRLAAEVDAANQTIAAAVASYTQAQALVRGTRSAYYPGVGIDASGRRFGGGNGSAGSTGGTGTGTANAFAASLNGDWRPTSGAASRAPSKGRAPASKAAPPTSLQRVSRHRARWRSTISRCARPTSRPTCWRGRSTATSARCRSRRTATPPASSPRPTCCRRRPSC